MGARAVAARAEGIRVVIHRSPFGPFNGPVASGRRRRLGSQRNKRARKPADVYARELIVRYGKRAGQVASNRYDAAETEATAAYYEQVMTEIENARREATRKGVSL